MCTSCGSMQEGNGHFCEKCGAPVTQHAHSDYVLGIQSRGFALHQATTNPKKFIVVIGIWLWVGTSFAFCLSVLLSGFVVVPMGEPLGGFLLIVAGSAGTLLFGTILFRTTTSWLEQRTGASRTSASESHEQESEPDDRQECLECGKSFAGNLSRCPGCGWSYRDEGPDEVAT